MDLFCHYLIRNYITELRFGSFNILTLYKYWSYSVSSIFLCVNIIILKYTMHCFTFAVYLILIFLQKFSHYSHTFLRRWILEFFSLLHKTALPAGTLVHSDWIVAISFFLLGMHNHFHLWLNLNEDNCEFFIILFRFTWSNRPLSF